MSDLLLPLLATIERLDAAATPGPWEWLHGYLRGAHLHFGCSDGCTGGDPDDRSFVIDGGRHGRGPYRTGERHDRDDSADGGGGGTWLIVSCSST